MTGWWAARAAITCALGLLFAPLAVDAQGQTQMLRVGVLGEVFDDLASFRQGLGELGYVGGRNVAIDYRPELGRAGRFEVIADELVRHKVDVIFAVGPAALKAAAKATRHVPIVAIDLETDPVESGFAASLSRPGGNITGLFLDLPELMGKWLELVKETVPRLSRITVLWDPATGRFQLAAAKAAARSLALQLQAVEVRSSDELERAFEVATRGRPGALIQLSSPIMAINAKRIADLSVKNRLPAISLFRAFAESGGLMAYGPDLVDLFRRCSVYTGRILKGAKPADLPIERPTKFDFVISLKTAKALGLTIPQSLLVRADQLLE